MDLTSPILRSDLALLPADAIWRDCGDVISVHTSSAPNFFWGNYLIVPRTGSSCSAAQLVELFHQRFDCDHIAIAWDSDVLPSRATLNAFDRMGFEIDQCHGLSFAEIAEPLMELSTNDVRQIESDEDWQRVVSLQQMMLGENTNLADRELVSRRFQRFRQLVSAGNGFWFGAFSDGQLAADLGIFVFDGIARFQQIETHPSFRRRGYCTQLLIAAIQQVRRAFGHVRIVLEAEADSDALALYRKIGFAPTETLISAFKLPKSLI
ncbi:hypothetical protein MXMO3_02120 [Maritalea myrionectae]|uniref:N-acetyltransferase domain-containing protein n=2 Tax=Maritalea myrionectae TaxID=454601 RepID=A0A2R4MF20_9HYPH|nr:hypothetical protein MXMO3_02120 [Maritalea myrionectae]